MNGILADNSHVVEDLKFKADEPNINELIKSKLGDDYTGPAAFQIKNELQRQNKPSKRSIQINEIISKAEPDPFSFDDVYHYLDPLSAAYFRRLFEGYGCRYTVGVEERVLDFIKSNKENILNLQQNRHANVVGVALHEHIYRKEERMHLGIRLWVDSIRGEFNEKTLYHRNNMRDAEEALSQNISMNGLKLKHSRAGKVGQCYAVRFAGWEKDFVMPQNAVVYQLVKSERIAESEDSMSEWQHVWYLKLVDNNHHDSFLVFLGQQISANRHRYRVDMDNVERSVVNQITEQFITNRQDGFSLFADAERRIRYAYGSLMGQERYDNFKHSGGHVLLPIIERENIWVESEGKPVFLCGFKQRNGVFFAALLNGDEENFAFCCYALTRPDAFVFRVEQQCCDLRNAFLSHNLPEDAAAKSYTVRAKRNINEYGDDTRAVVNSLKVMLTFSPMPVQLIASTLPLITSATEQQLVAFKRFGLLQVKRCGAPFVRAKSKELRREDRFKLDAPFEIPSYNAKGHVIDVSASGIAVSLEEGRMPSDGKIVSLHFPTLPVLKHLSPEVTYRVVASNGKLLRLSAEIDGGLSERRYWSAYFDKNIDILEPVEDLSINQGALFGLDRALRNIRNTANNTMHALLRVRNARAVATHVNVPADVANWPLFKGIKPNYQPSLALKALFCNLPFQDYLSDKLRLINKDNPFEYGLLAVFHQGFDDGAPVIQGVRVFNEPLKSSNQIAQFTTMLEKRGLTVSWFSLSLTRKSRIYDRYFRDELSYISKMAVHRAEPLNEMIEKTIGVLQISPIDDWLQVSQPVLAMAKDRKIHA